MQKTKLQEYFPMLKSREEIQKTIDERENLTGIFYSWEKKRQEEFLDFCSGARGVKMLYDVFAKAILDPEKYPERLNDILSLLLEKKVTIIKILPNEGIRIAAEKSLLVMDIVVKLEDGSIAKMDENTVKYMMDEMQEEIDRKKAELAELESNLAKKDEDLAKKDEDLAKKDEDLAKKDEALARKDADLQAALRRIAELEAEKQHL